MGKFFCGVIEGFYGRQWSWASRHQYAAFLSGTEMNTYLFAPKGEASLRSAWQRPFDDDLYSQLQQLGAVYHHRQLRWGIGLSPMGLNEQYSATAKKALKSKIESINALGADVLCLLFDDMEGANDQLASRQLAILDDVLSVSRAKQHIICPSYYSFDPVLEEVFGKMPAGYLEQLGNGLPCQVDYFWTGNQVISECFTQHDLQRITDLMGRKPILWDNYPVNDGRKTSPYLHLRAYTGRPHELEEWTSGHCVNPMNQAVLSMPVLATLSEVYRNREAYRSERALLKTLKQLYPADLAEQLLADIALFQDQGLDGIGDELSSSLINRYQQFSHPAGQEIVEWLQGQFRFDPACLTG